MGTLQISTSHNFANTGPIKKIQNVLKSEWWDLSAYEISWILLTVRYIALDHLTWNDPLIFTDLTLNLKQMFTLQNFSEALWPSGWALGQATWAKMTIKLLHLWRQSQKIRTPKQKFFFRVQST